MTTATSHERFSFPTIAIEIVIVIPASVKKSLLRIGRPLGVAA